MNMFKPSKVNSNKEYFSQLPRDRKVTLLFLDKLIRKLAPTLKPAFSFNMPGYGFFKYKNYKGEIINWPVIAIANQKNYISIYICALENNRYIAEKYKTELGKVSVGKSCIRFKKIEDLNLETLEEVIKLAEKNPGLLKS